MTLRPDCWNSYMKGEKVDPASFSLRGRIKKTGSLLIDEWECEKYSPCPTGTWIGTEITGIGI